MSEIRTEALDELARTVVRRVAEEVPALAERVVQRMIDEIPFYSSGVAGDRETLVERVTSNVYSVVEGLKTRRHDPTRATETGRLRAQNEAPLADVLRAYRFAFGDTWDALVEASRVPPAVPAEALVDLASAVFRLHNLESEAVVRAYHLETHQILLTRERERAALIDVMLSDDAGPGMLLEVARPLGLPLEGAFLVVAGESELGRDPMPRVSAALTVSDVRSVWRLRRDVLVGVLWMPGPAHSDGTLEILSRHATAPVGVSPVFSTLSRVSWGLKLAHVALRQIAEGEAVARQFQNTPLNLLVAASPQAARETAEAVLGDLLELGHDRSGLLLETLEAWVEAGGSADRTSEVLFCHPNTIRKRLKRIEQVTGRILTHPADVAELVAAGRAWTHFRRP